MGKMHGYEMGVELPISVATGPGLLPEGTVEELEPATRAGLELLGGAGTGTACTTDGTLEELDAAEAAELPLVCRGKSSM